MTTKSDWELLGIEPTVDIRQIKKAYARKLKIYSPEDNPVQFQILRQVYERALQYAEYADSSRFTEDNFNTEDTFDIEDTFDTEDTACEDENFYNPYEEEREAAESGYVKTECVENTLREPEIRELTDPMPALEKFKKQVNDLYADFNSRLSPEKWDEIVKDELLLWDIETYRILKTWFLDFLYAGHFVPSEVMVAYNKYFLWEINNEEYNQRYDDLFLTYIKEQIDGIIVPGYEYLMRRSGGDIEAYIRYREYGFAQYLIGDWDNANQNLSKAMEMIPEDPYLLCVFGALNVVMNETDGKKYIKSGAESAADPCKMFLFSGLLLHRAGKDKKALRYYRKIPRTSCYYITAQLGISNWLYKRKRYHICGLLLRSRLKKDRNNTQLKMALSQYYNTILDLKKKFPNRLVFWYEARKIFPYVRNRGEKNPHKYTLNYILHSFKLIVLTILALFLLMCLIASGGRGLLPIIIIYRLVQRHKVKKEQA